MHIPHFALFLRSPDLLVRCWPVPLNNRPKFLSIKPKLLDLKGLIHVDFLFKAVEPCTVQSSTGKEFCLLCIEMELLLIKINIISHANYIFKIVCNYEDDLVFSLHYLNFHFILTSIALLVF